MTLIKKKKNTPALTTKSALGMPRLFSTSSDDIGDDLAGEMKFTKSNLKPVKLEQQMHEMPKDTAVQAKNIQKACPRHKEVPRVAIDAATQVPKQMARVLPLHMARFRVSHFKSNQHISMLFCFIWTDAFTIHR